MDADISMRIGLYYLLLQRLLPETVELVAQKYPLGMVFRNQLCIKIQKRLRNMVSVVVSWPLISVSSMLGSLEGVGIL